MSGSKRPRRHLLARAVALLVTALAAVVLSPTPAHAAPPTGCSYSSTFRFSSDSTGSHAANFSGYSYGVPFCLRSPDRSRYVIFQDDGNLVVYSSLGGRWHSTWATYTTVANNRFASRLAFQNDGNMVLYCDNFDGFDDTTVSWTARTTGTHRADYISMQNDGNLVLRNGSGVAQWSSGTAGR